MIQLKQQDCHPEIALCLAVVRGSWSDITAVAWSDQAGPWSGFLPGDDHKHFFSKDGLKLRALHAGLRDNEPMLDLSGAVHLVLDRYHRRSRVKLAIVVRPNGYLVLYANRRRQSFFAQAPYLSAHERVTDIDLIEREFPGIFTFA